MSNRESSDLRRALLAGMLLITIHQARGVAWARPCTPEEEARIAAGAEDIEGLTARLAAGPREWWAARPGQIQKAKCRVAVPTNAVMESYFESWAKDLGQATKNETIRGIQFENENPKALEAFRELTSTRDGFGLPTTGAEAKFKSKCKKVACAVKEIFGAEEGPRQLYLFSRFGANASSIKVESSQKPKASELNDIISGLSDFPATLLPREKTFPIRRVKDGLGMPGTLANAVIMLFETWSDQPRAIRQSTLLHEFAHRLAGEMDLDQSAEWLKIAGWKVKPSSSSRRSLSIFDDYELRDESKAVSRYAKENPAEDFAESAVAYRYNPNELLKRSPEKYRYMKEVVFQGLEYTAPEKCSPEKSYGALIERKVGAEIREPVQIPPAILKESLADCATSILGELPASGELPRQLSSETQQCLKEKTIGAYGRVAFDQVVKDLKYPDLAKSILSQGGGRPDVPVSGTLASKLVEKSTREARERLRKTLVAALADQASFDLYARVKKDLTARQFCEDFTKYAYQWVEKVPNNDFDDKKDSLDIFKSRDSINAFMNSVCFSLQSSQDRRFAPSRAAIEAEITKRIPN